MIFMKTLLTFYIYSVMSYEYNVTRLLGILYNIGVALPLNDLRQLTQNIMYVGSVVEKVCRAESRISAQTLPE